MRDASREEEEYNLWLLLLQTKDIMFNIRQEEMRQYGISATQAAVLFVVQAIGNVATPAEIARWLLRRPHSVSGILNRMEKVGLVTKTRDLDKKNLVRITLTDKGRQVCRQAAKIESIHRIMSTLSKTERWQLRSCLMKLRSKGIEDLQMSTIPLWSPPKTVSF